MVTLNTEITLTTGHGLSMNGSTRSARESLDNIQQTERNGNERLSSLSFASSANDAFNEAGRRKGMILPFQPLAISFDDIKYYVDMPAVRYLQLSSYVPNSTYLDKRHSGKRLQVLRCVVATLAITLVWFEVYPTFNPIKRSSMRITVGK